MTQINLKQQMPNGVPVSDWLGTAALAARVAASHLKDIREEADSDPATLTVVEEYLEQALLEVRAVKRALVA